MKRLLLILLIFSLLLSVFFTSCQKNTDSNIDDTTLPPETSAEPNKQGPPKMVTCMSFNILGVDGDPPGIAPGRKRFPYVVELIKKYDPDILCLQEAYHKPFDWYQSMIDVFCVNDIYDVYTVEQDLGDMQTVANGLMIFYKNECFELLDSGYSLYSNNINNIRGYNWVQLRDKSQNKEVFVTNTHWSVDRDQNYRPSTTAGDKDRTNQANTLLEFFNSTVKDNILFACGDYNCKMDSKWFKILSQGIYQDGKIAMKQSYVGYVDHCFINPQAVNLTHYVYVTQKYTSGSKEYLYSDHFPVFVRVKY